MKIIAAEKPLSIQVHPSASQAQEGFEREQQQKIPFDAPHRSYRDANHKPELLVALTEMYALCGFRSPHEIKIQLEILSEIQTLLPPFSPTNQGIQAMLEAYFALPSEPLQLAWSKVLERIADTPSSKTTSVYWALQAHHSLNEGNPPDRGLLFVFILTLIRLLPGQAIFLPAGMPHAYLRGAGVELMANSDNVLRAGLTLKHIAPEELLKVVRFDARAPILLDPLWNEEREEGVYPTPSTEFQLNCLKISPSTTLEREANGPELLLAFPKDLDHYIRISSSNGEVNLQRGWACFIPAHETYRIEVDAPATLYRAIVPGAERVTTFRGRTPQQLAFGTSGLRGLVTDITDLEAYINTRGFLDFLVTRGDAVPGTQVAIAGDLRPSTDSPSRSILRAVAQAIRDAGMDAIYYGRIPTPALTSFGIEQNCPSIMVTGSHIPFDRNGIKFNKSDGEVLKSDEATILEAVNRVRLREYNCARSASRFDANGWFLEGQFEQLAAAREDARLHYIQRYLTVFPKDALLGLRVALYEHSAVGREVVAEILRGLGAEVLPVGRSETFVAIDTEAISAEQLVFLQTLAEDIRSRFGAVDAIVSTDGDSDRPMLLSVDTGGKVHFIGGDVLGTLVADELGVDAITVPVSASDMIDLHFAPKGIPIKRTRIGSPWVIAAMMSGKGERRVGWEANGGFLTGSTLKFPHGRLLPLPTRDAVLPLVSALYASCRTGRSLIDLVAALPARFSKSGLLDQVDPTQSRALLARLVLASENVTEVQFKDDRVQGLDEQGKPVDVKNLQKKFVDTCTKLQVFFSKNHGFASIERINFLDGLRIWFAGGDIAHVRPSGNAPQLRIYAVANTEERANEIVALGIAEPDGILRKLLQGG